MPQPVLHQLTHHRYLRERLEAAFPDADEETLMDTLEGMTSLTDSLAELLRSSQEDQSLASALRGRMSDMQERCGRFEERARKKRELVCTVMEEAELKKLMEPDFTVSLRPARAPLIAHSDESGQRFRRESGHPFRSKTATFSAPRFGRRDRRRWVIG